MAQKIGLIAELDLSKWTGAVSSYLGSTKKMQDANSALASNAGAAATATVRAQEKTVAGAEKTSDKLVKLLAKNTDKYLKDALKITAQAEKTAAIEIKVAEQVRDRTIRALAQSTEKYLKDSLRVAEQAEKTAEREARAVEKTRDRIIKALAAATEKHLKDSLRVAVQAEKDAERAARATEKEAERQIRAYNKAAAAAIRASQRAAAVAVREAEKTAIAQRRAIGGFLGGVGGGIGGAVGGIGGILGGVTGGIGAAIGGIGKSITSLLSASLGGIGNVISSLLQLTIGNAFSLLSKTVLGVVGGIAKGVLSLFGGMVKGVVSLITGTIGGAFSVLGKVIFGVVSGITKGVIGLFQGLVSGVSSVVTGLISGIAGAFTSIASSVIGIVGGLVSGVASAFVSLAGTVVGAVGNLVSNIVSAFTSLIGTVTGIVGNLIKGVASAFTSLVGSVINIVGNIARGIFNVFSSILKTVTSIVTTLATSVFNIFTSLAKSVIGVVTEMAKSVFNIISNLVKTVSQTLMSMAGSILSAYRDLGTQLTRIITVATVAVVGAVILAGKKLSGWVSDGIAGAIEFEQSMADIASVLRKTRLEVQPLADEIDKLALDPQLVVSTEGASAVIEQLARNGLTMTQILEGAAEASILLANATGAGQESFAHAADIATMAMQMFGLKASDMNRIADISQGVINNSRIELEDWSLALGNGGAAAATANVSLEEFATGIAATVNLYHTARQAGTGMTNFIQRLVPLTDVAADEMKKLGLFTGLTDEAFAALATEITETEQRIADLDPRLVHYDELVEAHTKHLEELKGQMVKGTNAFFFNEEEAALARSNGQLDARIGGFKGLAEASEILKNATQGLTEIELIEANKRIFGLDALETAIGFARMGKDAFNALQAELAIEGSAAEAAAVRTATLAKRWENLQDIWLAIQRKSGAGFNDMLLKLVNRLTALTNQNQDRIISFFAEMAVVVDKIVTAMMPWVEKMLPVLIDNLEALAHYVLAVVEDGDIMNDWLTHMSPSVKQFVFRIIDGINAVMQFGKQLFAMGLKAWEALKPFRDWIKENVEFNDVLIAIAGAIMTSIVPGILRLGAVALFAVTSVARIRKAWETDWGGIRTFFQETWPKIQKPLSDFINNILTGEWGDAWDNAVAIVGTALQELEKAVPDFFKNFVNLASDLLRGDWSGAWDNVVAIAKKSFNLIKQFLKGLETPISDFITDVLEGNWPKVWKKISETAHKSFDLIIEMLKALETPFTDFIVDVLEGAWKRVWERIVTETRKALNKVAGVLYSFDMPFTNFLGNVLTGKWDLAWKQVKDGATFAYNWVIDELYKIDTPVSTFLADVLTGKWDKVWESVKTGATTAYNWVTDELYALDMPFTTFIANVLTGKWGAAWEQAKNVVVVVRDYIVDWLEGFDSPFTDFAADVLVGNWGKAWEDAKLATTIVRDTIVAWLLELDTPFATFAANVLVGNWGAAWEQAKNVTLTVRDAIVEWLEQFDTPFSDFAQNILVGNWGGAWENAKQITLDVRDGIVEWLEGLDSPFTDFAADILVGNWGKAWEDAKLATLAVRDAIIEWLADKGPWAAFATDILQGEWKNAWDGAKAAIFGEGGILPKIHAWLVDKGPWGVFASDILKGDFTLAWNDFRELLWGPDGIITKLLAWLADTGPWGSFAANVLRGDFKTAWDELRVLIGLTDDKIKMVKDTLYILVGAFAIATATLITFNLRGIGGVLAGIAQLGLIFIRFIPLIGAIALAVAMLRVAWEEDFMGIQAFTVKVIKALGTVFQVGLLIMGNLVDLFLLVMKEDWEGAWLKIQDIAKFSWQIIARAALLGLTLIESFMLEGPGISIINWLSSTFPTVLIGLQTVFESTASLLSTAWITVTENIIGTKTTWGDFFSFIETTIGTAAQRIGNFIGFIDGVMKYFNNTMQASRDAVEGMELEGKKALALSKGDTAGADAIQLEIQQHTLESAATEHAVTAPVMDFITQSQEEFMNAWLPNDQLIKDRATASGAAFIDTILSVTAANKKKLQEGIIPSFIDEEMIKNRFGPQATLVGQLFDRLGAGVAGEISWADILREPVAGSDLGKLQSQFDAILSKFTFPAAGTTTDPNHPTNVFNSIFDAIKQLGIDLTGDFLNVGGEAVGNLGEGAIAEKTSVVTIFQGIMAEITAAAANMVESFKALGVNIGDSLKLGVETQLEIDSPSKVFQRMGEYAAQGFADGWNKSMEFLQLRNAIVQPGTAAAKVSDRMKDFIEVVQIGSRSQILSATEKMGLLSKDLADIIQNGTKEQIQSAMFTRTSQSSSYSTYNSPVTINNYIYNQMDQAQLEYTMQNMLNKAGMRV